MFIFLTVLILVLAALALLVLRLVRPDFNYIWLVAAGSALLAWFSVFLWQFFMPTNWTLTVWQPTSIFSYSPALLADNISWPFALSLTALGLAVILAATVRSDQISSESLAGTLILTALGLVAVLASNPLALVMAWAAIDLAELVTMLRTFEGPRESQSAVVAFTLRILGLLVVSWASIVALAEGKPFDFRSTPPYVGVYLLLGAALRLGVLPLHLPYPPATNLRRGFGTILRLVAAASSLILLARIPPGAVDPGLSVLLTILTAIAALYGGWMWLRSPDELTGRPYWLIGMASLAVAAALRENPVGSAAWGCALLLSGGLIFLYSDRTRWLTLLPLISIFGFSALPLSATASGWQSGPGLSWLAWVPFLPAQALLAAGFLRFATQPGTHKFAELPQWAQMVYPAGPVLLAVTTLILGLWGWSGAALLGVWPAGLIAVVLAGVITWITLRVIKYAPGEGPEASGRLSAAGGRLGALLESAYRALGFLTALIASTLEGDGGVLWTLLLLVLLVTIIRGSR